MHGTPRKPQLRKLLICGLTQPHSRVGIRADPHSASIFFTSSSVLSRKYVHIVAGL
jgi:hypothetical protein